MSLVIGFSLGALIGWMAWKAGALSVSGAVAATLTGGLIFGIGGLSWAVVLLLFFTSSSMLSRLFHRRKAEVSEKFSKGSRRDWGQVFANGGLGALLALALAAAPQTGWVWFAFAGAMAAVNADTWATELGVLSSAPPRLVTNGRIVERGTSGGITLLGTLAALAGAGLVGLAAALFHPGLESEPAFLIAIGVFVLSGMAGALFDSWLGATWQAIYFCPVCRKETERHPVHSCGSQTTRIRGLVWLSNDIVNFFCSLMGALIAVAFWQAFFNS